MSPTLRLLLRALLAGGLAPLWAEPPPDAPEPNLTLVNGRMERGAATPESWRGRFGQVHVSRDTTTHHEGAASLCLENLRAKGLGGAYQTLSVTPGMKITFSGWWKTEAEGHTKFAAQFFDEAFTREDWEVIDESAGPQDWKGSEKAITVPEGATHLNLGIFLEGRGRAWLDDVAIADPKIAAPSPPPEATPTPPTPPADPAAWPTTPAPGYYPAYPRAWKFLHERLAQQARSGGVDLLFLGDSLTANWLTEGRAAWEKLGPPLHATCFGIGGDATGQVLWRLDHGELKGLSPKAVILMIGIHNVLNGYNTPEQIVAGIRATVEKIHAQFPAAKTLILSLLPCGLHPGDAGRETVAEVNRLAASLANGENLFFGDIAGKFVNTKGDQVPGLFDPDHLHLTAQGYETFAKALAPALVDLAKE